MRALAVWAVCVAAGGAGAVMLCVALDALSW